MMLTIYPEKRKIFYSHRILVLDLGPRIAPEI